MQQIMEVASGMGLNISDQTTGIPKLPTPEAMKQITQALQQSETRDRRQETLIKALLPYLRPNRQARLERAMQLSHLSRLAGAALQNTALSFLQSEEDSNHV